MERNAEQAMVKHRPFSQCPRNIRKKKKFKKEKTPGTQENGWNVWLLEVTGQAGKMKLNNRWCTQLERNLTKTNREDQNKDQK